MFESGAIFSPCRKYRYTLHRVWQPAGRRLLFILLNPSRADETKNDATITRCITRAINSGYGSLEIVNLFAWRSTYPVSLRRAADPVGPDNDFHIAEALRRAQMVICGWGGAGQLDGRDRRVLELIDLAHITPYALRVSNGIPWHPLYLSYKLKPIPLSREVPLKASLCFNRFMDDDKLIERLEEGVREAEELLRRRKDALAALKGKAGTGKKAGRVRGLRPGSLPALAHAALKTLKQPIPLDELTAHLKKNNAALDSRKVSLALSRYVRLGHHFAVGDDGKYSAK